MREITEIRTAINESLLGMDALPSLESRVLARANGKRRGPIRLSAAAALTLMLTLLTVVALAAGGLLGLFRIEQEDVGALRGCVSDGNTLYLMSSSGLHSWQPGDETPSLLLSSDQMHREGFSFECLLYLDESGIGLLHPQSKSLWRYENGSLVKQLDYAGTPMDISGVRYDSALMRDGWLFLRTLTSKDTAQGALVHRVNPQDGSAQTLPLTGVSELCAYEPEKLLALIGDSASKQDRLAVVNMEGEILEVLYQTNAQGIVGIAYAADRREIYALVHGVPSRWTGNGWQAMQGYAPHYLADSFAIVEDGYTMASFDSVQYVPFSEPESLPTLTIHGYFPANNEDEIFQKDHPQIAVVRQRDPALTAADVREAIQNGATTDLFYVKLDSELLEMMQEGLLAPLSSEMLLSDTAEMLPLFQQALTHEDKLYAVPGMVTILTWKSQTDVPTDFIGLLGKDIQWKQETPYIGHHWADAGWTKSDYADFLLTTFIAQNAQTGEAWTFRDQAFVMALEALKKAELPERSGKAEVTTQETLSLSGDLPADIRNSEAGVREYSSDAPGSLSEVPNWGIPAVVGMTAKPSLPVTLAVYVINTNAQNPDLAIMYAEQIALGRNSEDDACLKPLTAEPVIHPGTQQMIDWLIEDQYAYDAQLGVETDETALQQRVDAIRAAPDSWAVYEPKLNEYRERIVPVLDLRLSPLLCSTAKREGGSYHQMLATVTDCVEGRITVEECVTLLDETKKNELQ